jgi:hypothetical protein
LGAVGGTDTFFAAGATPLVVYVQCVAGSATGAAEVVAEAEADGVADGDADVVALGFVAAGGALPPTKAAVSPPIKPRTQTTARPTPNR